MFWRRVLVFFSVMSYQVLAPGESSVEKNSLIANCLVPKVSMELGAGQFEETFERCWLRWELEGLVPWLGARVCASVHFPLLPVLSALLPIVLLADPDLGEDCTALLLTDAETWRMEPLSTPSTQRVFILNNPIRSIKFSSLEGRQAVISSCNSSILYVKTEFESNLRKIHRKYLLKNLPCDSISKERTVVLGTFNCSIYSAFGPLNKGKPEWIDGVEMLGVTSVLNSGGFDWSIYPASGMGKVYPDGSLEKGKFKWLIKNGLVDIGFCAFWTNNAIIGNVINPWQRSCTRLLVPQPKNIYPYWHTVFHPLPLEFWSILILFNLFTAGTLTLFNWLFLNQKIYSGTVCEDWYKAVTFITYGIKTSNGKNWQVIQVAWALFILIASAAYSSSLASILTTPAEEEVPQTLVELLEKGFVWASGIEPMANPEYYFKTHSGVDEEWLKYKISDDKIVKGKTAILGEELNGLYTMNKANKYSKEFLDTLMISKECLAANHISILTRKMSPYYEYMVAGFSRLAESGVLMKILSNGKRSPHLKRYIVHNAYKEKYNHSRGVSLGLPPLRGAFYVLVGGHLFGFIVFLCEVLYFYKEKDEGEIKNMYFLR